MTEGNRQRLGAVPCAFVFMLDRLRVLVAARVEGNLDYMLSTFFEDSSSPPGHRIQWASFGMDKGDCTGKGRCNDLGRCECLTGHGVLRHLCHTPRDENHTRTSSRVPLLRMRQTREHVAWHTLSTVVLLTDASHKAHTDH